MSTGDTLVKENLNYQSSSILYTVFHTHKISRKSCHVGDFGVTWWPCKALFSSREEPSEIALWILPTLFNKCNLKSIWWLNWWISIYQFWLNLSTNWWDILFLYFFFLLAFKPRIRFKNLWSCIDTSNLKGILKIKIKWKQKN